MVYLVSYDLNASEQDYQKLINAICRYENPCRVLRSQWLIQSDKSAKQIFNELVAFIDSDDELFICELNPNCAGSLTKEKISWLQTFLISPQLLPRFLG